MGINHGLLGQEKMRWMAWNFVLWVNWGALGFDIESIVGDLFVKVIKPVPNVNSKLKL